MFWTRTFTMLQISTRSLRRFIRPINIFYKNPIVGYIDVHHLDGKRTHLPNPNLAISAVLSILKNHSDVEDAISEFDGEYLLEAAVVDDELRVNVFDVSANRVPMLSQNVFDINWAEESFYRYLVDATTPKRATIRPVLGVAYGCYYD